MKIKGTDVEEQSGSEISDDFSVHKRSGPKPFTENDFFGDLQQQFVKCPQKAIVKQIEREGQEREWTSHWVEMTFKKVLEQRENAEYEDIIKGLINLLNIETSHYQSDQGYHTEDKEFVDIIQRVNYLDCSGLEQQSSIFEPFSHSSFDDFHGRIANYEVFRKMESGKSRLILSTLFSAYTKETLFEFQPRDLTFFIHRCLEYAIENQNHILVIELVRSYIFDSDLHFSRAFEEKEINPVVMDTFLKTAKHIILKQYPMLKQNAIRLSFCRECSPENRLVLMMLYKGSNEIKVGIPEKVMGVELVPYNYTQPSDEASAVFNTIEASCLSKNLPVITEKDARKLFKKHSNLTLISASPFKSSGYLKGNHIIVEKHCVSLLCLHKGYIPFGEREFPKQINGFDVDVQEGYCSLGSGKSVDFGGHIRRARGINTPTSGSIGGFVDLPNDSVGLITCAHVVLSSDELKIPNSDMMNYVLKSRTDFNVETFDKDRHKFQVCGSIVDKCFPLSSRNKSVDAALIKLDPSVREFKFPVTVTDQLFSAGFDPNRPPIFTGEVVSVPHSDPFLKDGNRIPGVLDSVVKYGSKSGFTIGNLYYNGSHIRFVDDTGELPDKTRVIMCNQIEIQSLPLGIFFETGDSGAFVFCINSDKTLSCLGMAVGFTTKGSCFVTPIERILDSFGLPHRLKPNSSYVSRSTSRLPDHSSLRFAEQGDIIAEDHGPSFLKNEEVRDQHKSIKKEKREDIKDIDPEIHTENLLQHMKTEVTTVRHARGVVVGCAGAGKTTLLYRLMGKSLKEIKEIESTLGLQVYEHIFTVQDMSFQATDHLSRKPLIRIPISSLKMKKEENISKEKMMMDKDSFHKKEDMDDIPAEKVESNDEIEDYNRRSSVSGDEFNIQKCTIIEKDEQLGDVGKDLNLPSTHDITVKEARATNIASSSEPQEKYMVVETLSPEVNEQSTSIMMSNVEHETILYTRVKDIVAETLSPEVIRKILDTQENEISISMIDFAGQFSYYACHQIYMRSSAFYILVMDLTKSFEEVVSGMKGKQNESLFSSWKYKDYVEFWLNSICSFGGPKAPVLLVATHAEGKTEDDIEEFFQCLWRSLPKTIKSWLSSEAEFAFGLLDVNEDKTSEKLDCLKDSIVDLVSNKLETKIKVPSSWALLEHLLQNSGKPMISCDEIQDLNKQLPEEYRLECNTEITDFLLFFHDHGLLLYFKGEATRTHAILDIQWFSDAFSKLVADKKHINKDCRRRYIEEWEHFNQTGELHTALVDALWKGENTQSYKKYKKELMAYMERLRMLVSIGDIKQAQSWYVPCMNKKQFKTDIIKPNMARSSILCFRFSSFAMFVFYRLVAFCMIYLKWNIVPDREGKCLFQTAAMFEYKNHTVKLGICDKDIQLQIITNSSDIDIRVSYEIGITIHKAIEELTQTFFEDKFLNFQKGYKCEDKFCDQNDTSFTPEENLRQLETENIECSCCPIGEKHQINIHRTRRYWEKETLSTSITSGQNLSGRTRFAKLGMATNDVLNKVYRDILELEIPPSDIEKEVNSLSNKKRMNLKLNPDQEDLLKTAKISGYKEFDISLTYKMIRNICSKIPKPTKGKWGEEPAAREMKVGDDVERIRSIRNNLSVHVSSASIPQKEFDDTWLMMSDICNRLETFTGNKYLDKLNYIQKLTLKEEDEDNVIEKVKMESQHEMMKTIMTGVQELKAAVLRPEAKHAPDYDYYS